MYKHSTDFFYVNNIFKNKELLKRGFLPEEVFVDENERLTLAFKRTDELWSAWKEIKEKAK